MDNKGRSLGVISLDDEWMDRTVDLVREELQIPELDLEQRESLERFVMMSVAFYFMCARESGDRTTRLNQ
jgi:hypothetical protein